jgi:hypothetical protein
LSDANGLPGWAIIELMGHRRIVGYVAEVEVAGQGMLRVDTPSDPPTTQLYAPSALYAIHPATEDLARALAKRLRHEPVTVFDLPRALPEAQAMEFEGESEYLEDEDADQDEDEQF